MDANDRKPPKTPEEDWIVVTLAEALGGPTDEEMIVVLRKLAQAYRAGKISAETAVATAKIIAVKKEGDPPMSRGTQFENKSFNVHAPGTDAYRENYERIFAKVPTYPSACVGCGVSVGEKEDHAALEDKVRCAACGPFTPPVDTDITGATEESGETES
jgi:hypothetical protein